VRPEGSQFNGAAGRAQGDFAVYQVYPRGLTGI